MTDNGILITGAGDIAMVRLLALRGRLGLEVRGLGFSGRPTSVIVREMGVSTKKAKRGVYADLDAYIVSLGGPARPLA